MNAWTRGLVAAGLIPSLAFAGWNPVKELKKAAGDVVTVAVKTVDVATKPIQVQIKAAEGAVKVATGQSSPEQALNGVKKEIAATPKEAGEAIKSGASAVNHVNNLPLDAAAEAGKKVGGKTVELAVDAATLSQRINNSAGTTAANAAGSVLQGQNPLLALNPAGIALATALQAAHDQHKANAKPIPMHVKSALAKYFPASILNKARYTIGDTKIAVPDGIFAVHSDYHYAVTIDDIIVFKNPNASLSLWAHELQHVVQYARYGGIPGFAHEYTVNWKKLEAEGDAKSEKAGTEFAAR